jgi:hypothetical protein
MTVTVALAGDTMLGRGVARTLATTPPHALVAPEVRAALGAADLVLLGTDCVTLANNQALDYGVDALADTLEYLATALVDAGTTSAQFRELTQRGRLTCNPQNQSKSRWCPLRSRSPIQRVPSSTWCRLG